MDYFIADSDIDRDEKSMQSVCNVKKRGGFNNKNVFNRQKMLSHIRKILQMRRTT